MKTMQMKNKVTLEVMVVFYKKGILTKKEYNNKSQDTSAIDVASET